MSDTAETIWLIEPRDPLIVRDGRPFGPDPGARATTLPFPFPSAIAGALRHKAGLAHDGAFDRNQSEAVLQLAVRGPLLVQLHDAPDPAKDEQIVDWLLPAPADMLLLRGDRDEPGLRRYWLAPRDLVGGAVTALPDGLLPVSPARYDRRKPLDDEHMTRFWFWEKAFSHWLTEPNDGTWASAGSVYYVTFAEGADVDAWLEATRMKNVSDAEQDQRDGFGLAAVGVWPAEKMEVHNDPSAS